ncbi:MAG TPA: glycosyltransferase [Burkholderiaceae bacterium]|nr:glycosyltransferase [Burkholderiaceae bacterium]
MRLALIIPIHNRAQTIEESLLALADVRRRGHHIIVVDTGSSDNGAARARALADRVVVASQNLSSQLNAASRVPEAEQADALVFLPETVRLPEQADRTIARALSNSSSPWGRFDISYRNRHGDSSRPLDLAAALANWCSRATGICTWEQAIFISRSAFFALEGFAVATQCADIEFSRRARQLGAPIVLRERALVRISAGNWAAVSRAIVRREWQRLAVAVGFEPGEHASTNQGPF